MGFYSQEKAFVKSVIEACLRESNHEKITANHFGAFLIRMVDTKKAECFKNTRLIYSLNQLHSYFSAFLTHIFRPDACLNLPDMPFLQVQHTKTRLTYTTANA